MNRTPSLKVGIMVDSITQPAWVDSMLGQVISQNLAEITLVIENIDERTWFEKVWKNLPHLGYYIYEKIDRVIFRAIFRTLPDAFARRTISHYVHTAQKIAVRPKRTEYCDYFASEDIEKIKTAGCDLLLRLDFRVLRGDILKVAPLGVWSFHHGDSQRYRGGPSSFWEIIEGSPTTGVILQKLVEKLDCGSVLASHISPTYHYSLARSRHQNYWRGSELFERALKRTLGGHAINPEAPEITNQGALYRLPSNTFMLKKLLPMLFRWPLRIWQEIRPSDSWLMCWQDEKKEFGVISEYHRFDSPADGFIADPCAVEHNNNILIFCERWAKKTARGHIELIGMTNEGELLDPVCVLKENWHLSYPYVFKWKNQWWMVPESAEIERVDLYQATRFPYEWEWHSTLLSDINAVDSTLVEINEHWWMWTSTAPQYLDNWDVVKLYMAKSPLGPWVEHPLSPVVSDVRCARPAGRPFFRDGYWIRPTQDCSQGYGFALNFRRIKRISPTDYDEENWGEILPESVGNSMSGIHTWSVAGKRVFFDAKSGFSA